MAAIFGVEKLFHVVAYLWDFDFVVLGVIGSLNQDGEDRAIRVGRHGCRAIWHGVIGKAEIFRFAQGP